jgi:hypothetical protein
MSKAWGKRHGAALPSQLGDDRWDHVETHANGTGPFKLEAFEPGERMVLVRNPNWWGLAHHPHNIDRIVQERVDDPARGAELLLAHEIDLLQSPPPDQLERIATTPDLKVQKDESAQTLYLGFDQASPELRSSDVEGRNPFADRRVRQAFYQGIDIQRIIQALHGLAAPAGMGIWPKGIGWSEELDRRLPYDPAKPRHSSPKPASLKASTSRSPARRFVSWPAARLAPRCRRSASPPTSRSSRVPSWDIRSRRTRPVSSSGATPSRSTQSGSSRIAIAAMRISPARAMPISRLTR